MSQELITYIVLGSLERLKGLKLPSPSNNEEYILANFSKNKSFVESIDSLVFSSKGDLVVFLPPSAFPNSKSKKILKKISMIDQSSWGWFQYDERKNDFIQKLGNDCVIYSPKLSLQRYRNNKLINKEFNLLGDYLLCFHKNFENQTTLNYLSDL